MHFLVTDEETSGIGEIVVVSALLTASGIDTCARPDCDPGMPFLRYDYYTTQDDGAEHSLEHETFNVMQTSSHLCSTVKTVQPGIHD